MKTARRWQRQPDPPEPHDSRAVPLLDLTAQYAAIRGPIREAIDRVLDSQQFILGPEVMRLEEELAQLLECRYCIGVSSGTDALLAALMAVGVGPGDEVVTTAYSFYATAETVVRLGARPVFVDIDPASWNLDTDAAVARIGPRTKAVIPVHLFGRCTAVRPLLAAARDHDAVVIEDAAQAIMARTPEGPWAGTLGAVGTYSFFPTKNLAACGDGGLVVTDSDELADTLRAVRVHGSERRGGVYQHSRIGGNFRLDAIQAAVLGVKLRYLEDWTTRRRRNAARYREMFRAADLDEQLRWPADSPDHVYHQFVVRASRRDELREHLARSRIGSAVYYALPLPLQPGLRHLGYAQGEFPLAESASREALALPIYPELTEAQQQRVVDAIAEFYRAGRPRHT